MITCQECRERLNDLLDETSVSSKDGALRDFRAHAAGCTACTHDLALLRAAQSELRTMPEVPAPAALRARVLAALEAEKTAPKRGFGAAFEAFLQRPTRLAWAGGVLATACFLVILARTPQIQDSAPQFGESTYRREKVAATAQEKPRLQVLEPARRSAPASAKKSSGNVKSSAPIAAKMAEARSGDAAIITTAPSPMSPRSTAPKDLLRAKTPNTTQTFSNVPKAPTESAASEPLLTRRANDENSIARGPLVPGVTLPSLSTPRGSGPARTPNAAILPNRPHIAATPQIAEITQPSALRVRIANAPEAVSPALGASVESLHVPLTNRIAKMARSEDAALTAGAAESGPAASFNVAPSEGAALSLAVPRVKNGINDVPLVTAQSNAAADSVQAVIPAPPAGLSSAPGLSPRVPVKPDPILSQNSVLAENGTGPRNAPSIAQSRAANSYMMRQGVPGMAFPGGATTSGGGFGAKRDKGEALAKAAKPADERKDNKQEERQVLLLSIAREMTFNLVPTRDWKAVQLRLVLPSSLRFTDGKTSKILWHGAAQKGQKISVTTSLLAREACACQLRLILEQSAGGTLLPVQTQTIDIDVVR